MRVVFISAAISLLGACSKVSTETEIEAEPVSAIKPDIDYSTETPGCELAAQRLSENVEVGMTLAEVRRLVGQPRLILPGRWIWKSGFAFDGLPIVRYEFGPADDDVQITSFTSDSSSC